MPRCLVNLICLAIGVSACAFAHADLAVPPWHDGAWHYRVPVQVPAGAAVGSTVAVDTDFAALLGQLGVAAGSVDFDEASPRVVRPGGTLANTQQFSDRIFAGVLDPAGNGRGEIKFLLEDLPAAGNYYLYFDIVANGAKPVNPASPINGNFEHSAGSTPTGWVTSALSAGGNQNNEVYRTALGATASVPSGCSTGGVTANAGPNASSGSATGEAWHLLGYRDRCEDGSGNERIRLSRDIVVPSGSAAGALTFYFQVQGWDGISSNSNYDWVSVYVNGSTIDHRNLSIDNSSNPQLRIDRTRMGRQAYSNSYSDHGWKLATLDLSAYAGSTINFRIESRHSSSDNSYRAWVRVDDVAWSLATATLGAAEGFGINIVAPNDTAAATASIYTAGEAVVVAAAMDAAAITAQADIVDDLGAVVASNIVLFDDGSHGDVAAGDRIYTNDGSVGAEPTYTILTSDPQGANWLVRVRGRDASVSSVGATAGLLHRPGQPSNPEIQANFFNVDEQSFTVIFTTLEVTKDVATVRDPVNDTTRPKAIPGAWLTYTLTVTNHGPGSADPDSLIIVDQLGAGLALCVAAACNGGTDPVDFDDSGSSEPTGLTFDYASHVTYSINGVDFDHPPDPDGEGFDAAITHVRVAPAGGMGAPGPGGDPSFELRYSVRLD